MEPRIYDPWPLVEGMIKGETTYENAKQMAIALVEEFCIRDDRKSELWGANIWGRKEGKKADAQKVHGDKGLVPKAGHEDGSTSGVNL